MTIQEAIIHFSNILNEANIEVPSLDVEVLIMHILKKEKSFLYAHPEKQLTKEEVQELKRLIEKRKHNYPLAYLTHTKSFYDLDFYVDERVLIPRPETEILVSEVIKYAKGKNLRIADIGTGSGAIAINLKKHIPDAHIIATDISKDALDVAEKNAFDLKAKEIEFMHEDAFETLPEDIDILVSNPPYLKTHEVENLVAEPHQALDGGENGLEVYETLFSQITQKQIPAIFLEIGYDQSFEIEQLKHQYLPDYTFEVLADFCGFPRVIMMFHT